MTRLLLTIVLISATTAAQAETELDACRRLAAKYGAELEVVTKDGARCDMLTATEAIEVDWARKWAEGIGQSLYYATVLDRQPAVILLVTGESDQRYVARCRVVCERYGIRLYTEAATKNKAKEVGKQ
jgi:hypothetical protein